MARNEMTGYNVYHCQVETITDSICKYNIAYLHFISDYSRQKKVSSITAYYLLKPNGEGCLFRNDTWYDALYGDFCINNFKELQDKKCYSRINECNIDSNIWGIWIEILFWSYYLFLFGWIFEGIKPRIISLLKFEKPNSKSDNDSLSLSDFFQNILSWMGTRMSAIISIFSFILRFVVPSIAWILCNALFNLKHFEFIILIIPPSIVYYVYYFYYRRKSTESKNYSEYNLQESVHNSYSNQRVGCKSLNPIIRGLDYICQLYPRKKTTLICHYVVTSFFYLIMIIIMDLIVVWLPSDGDTTSSISYWLVFIHLICFIFVITKCDVVYRRLRHTYLKKHNLPGPYGWGTIDYHPYSSYTEEFSISKNIMPQED